MTRTSVLYVGSVGGGQSLLYSDWTPSVDEVDPYKKPADLLEVSPKGLVPALRLENHSPPRAVNESTVILEFLEE